MGAAVAVDDASTASFFAAASFFAIVDGVKVCLKGQASPFLHSPSWKNRQTLFLVDFGGLVVVVEERGDAADAVTAAAAASFAAAAASAFAFASATASSEAAAAFSAAAAIFATRSAIDSTS